MLVVLALDNIVALFQGLCRARKQLLHLEVAFGLAARLLPQLHLLNISASENALLVVVLHLVTSPELAEQRAADNAALVLPVLEDALEHEISVGVGLGLSQIGVLRSTNSLQLLVEVWQSTIDLRAHVVEAELS